jgi:hypothetical protein
LHLSLLRNTRLDDDLMDALAATDASSKAIASSGAVDTVASAEET